MRTKLAMTAVTAVVMSISPGAHASTARSATVDYIGPNGVSTPVYTTGFTIILVRPQLSIDVGPDETSASFSVSDATGRPVGVGVAQGSSVIDVFCGESDGPVAIEPGEQLRFVVLAGTCEDGSISAPTIGTIRADFS